MILNLSFSTTKKIISYAKYSWSRTQTEKRTKKPRKEYKVTLSKNVGFSKYFKVAITQMCKDLKEVMLKEVKHDNNQSTNEERQKEHINYFEKEPNRNWHWQEQLINLKWMRGDH